MDDDDIGRVNRDGLSVKAKAMLVMVATIAHIYS